jgi:nucleoside-diphosphate-sugar epimerase
MNLEHLSNRVLITGITGFTGKYLKEYLSERGFEVYGLTNNLEEQDENTFFSDITNKEHLQKTVLQIAPNYVIHLAAISFVGHPNDLDFYRVNVLGTQNLILSCIQLPKKPNKIILVSSATVYGNQSTDTLDETPAGTLVQINDYAVFDATFTHKLSDGVDAYIRIENLLDREYQTALGYGTSDRAFYLGLRSRF